MVEISNVNRSLQNPQNLQDFGDIFDDIGEFFKQLIDQLKSISDDIQKEIDKLHCKACKTLSNKGLKTGVQTTAFIITRDPATTKQATTKYDQQKNKACAACQRLLDRKAKELEEQRKRIDAFALMIYDSIYRYEPEIIILKKTRLKNAFKGSIKNILEKWEQISSKKDKQLYNAIIKEITSEQYLDNLEKKYNKLRKKKKVWTEIKKVIPKKHLPYSIRFGKGRSAGYDYKEGIKLREGVHLHWHQGWHGQPQWGFTPIFGLLYNKYPQIAFLPPKQIWKSVVVYSVEEGIKPELNAQIKKYGRTYRVQDIKDKYYTAWNQYIISQGREQWVKKQIEEWLKNYPPIKLKKKEKPKPKVPDPCEIVKNDAKFIYNEAEKANKGLKKAIDNYKKKPSKKTKDKLQKLIKGSPFGIALIEAKIEKYKECKLTYYVDKLNDSLKDLKKKIKTAKNLLEKPIKKPVKKPKEKPKKKEIIVIEEEKKEIKPIHIVAGGSAIIAVAAAIIFIPKLLKG